MFTQAIVQMQITAAVAHSLGEELKIEEAELMELEADEVLIEIVASRVCHTDAESMKKEEVLHFQL